ncbi:MAG: hypothetical protein IPK26_03620 [Planctomycetes bacterium]|nr:hypothetical protein [Planctomycetota bacterium]
MNKHFVCAAVLSVPLAAQQTWVPVAEEGLPGIGITEAPLRPRLVNASAFAAGYGIEATVTQFDGAAWRLRHDLAPPVVNLASSIVWDPVARRAVAHCSRVTPAGIGDATTIATFDGETWSVLATTNPPAPRSLPAFGQDGIGGRMLLFGGDVLRDRQRQVFDETWALSGGVWTQLSPVHAPTPRAGATMVFDPIRGRLVLFGGLGLSAELADTWEWDGSDWQQVATPVAPPARTRAAMGWHAGSQRVVLFGGTVGTVAGERRDAFAFDGSSWTPLSVPPSLPVLEIPQLLRDGNDLLLTGRPRGGEAVQTWRWDGSSFTAASPGSGLTARFLPAVAWDDAHGELIRFGGKELNAGVWHQDTWLWSPTSGWRLAQPATVPPPRDMAAMVHDPLRGEVLMFGGRNGSGELADTWIWNGVDWQQRATAVTPAARTRPGIAFHPMRGTVLMHGGDAANDTWSWDGANWTPLATGGSTLTGAASMAWDPRLAIMLLLVDRLPVSSVFQLTGNSWSAAPPVPARLFAIAWDPVASRIAGFWSQRYDFTGSAWVATGENGLGSIYVTAPSLGRMLAPYGLSAATSVFVSTPTPASHSHYGSACATTASPRLTLARRPQLGTTAEFELDTGAAGAPWWLVMGLQAVDRPLAGTCRDHVGTVVAILNGTAAGDGYATTTVAVPPIAALAGVAVQQQLWTLQPVAGGGFGWALSRGLQARLGD